MRRILAVVALALSLNGAPAPQVPSAVATECLAQEKDGVSGFCEGDTCYIAMERNNVLRLWETKQRMSPGRYSMFFMSENDACTFGTLRGDAVPEGVPAISHPAGQYIQFNDDDDRYKDVVQQEFARVAATFARFARPQVNRSAPIIKYLHSGPLSFEENELSYRVTHEHGLTIEVMRTGRDQQHFYERFTDQNLDGICDESTILRDGKRIQETGEYARAQRVILEHCRKHYLLPQF
jgi:hypothetical protein